MSFPKLGYFLKPVSTSATIKNTVSLQPEPGLYPGFSASGQDVWVKQFDYDGEAIIVSAVGARCGKTFLARGKWGAIANTTALRVDSGDAKYFWYLTNLPWFWEIGGAAQPFVKVSETLQKRMPVPVPLRQAVIAAYLDRETSRLDALVAKKTRFIELLREKRQALITQAVTKGLDPSVPMKDSGVEWLGDVPADWDTAPLRVFLQQRRDIVGSESRSTKLLSLTLQGVIERDLENPTGKMPASFDTYQRVADGEMVFCLFDMDETPRTVGIAPQDGMITGAYTVFRPTADVWARYLYYFFLHVDDHKRLKPFYKGMRKTIRPGPFLSIQVPRPSELAARDIADYLDRATARVDTLIAKTERSIELLREHLTALITAAVTGKIDLREAA